MGAIESSEMEGEWIQVVLAQLSPRFSEFASGILKDQIEPVIQNSLSASKNQDEEDEQDPSSSSRFQFESTDFGSVPPKLGNITAHTLTEEDGSKERRIVLDFDVNYEGDCNLQVRILGVRSGVRDLQFRGRGRLILGPTISSLPLVGGLQFFFLDVPRIQFDMGGLANMADWPVLRGKVRREILSDVAKHIVYPNRVALPISGKADPELVQGSMPKGYLWVRAVRAEGLPKKDGSIRSLFGQDKPDCYAKISLGAFSFETYEVKNSCDPEWEEAQWWCIPLELTRGHFLHFHLYDHDSMSRDEFVGKSSIYVEDILTCEGEDRVTNLMGDPTEKSKYSSVSGTLTFTSYWLPLSPNRPEGGLGLPDGIEMFSLAHVFVYSANNLVAEGQELTTGTPPNTVLRISYGGRNSVSKLFKKNSHPRYEFGAEFKVADGEEADIVLIAEDQNGTQLGRLELDLNNLPDNNTLDDDDDDEIPSLYNNALKRTMFQINPEGNQFATMTVSAGMRHLSRY